MRGKLRIINLLLVFVFLFSALGVTPKPVVAAASDLFISEYIEGSSNNKAIEIYNGTGADIDLDAGDYEIKFYFNSSTTAGNTIDLTGTVTDGDVYVVADNDSDAAILAETDQTNNGNFYNGDDAIEITKGGIVIDSIGQVGVDPGSEWGSGDISTQNNTIRRMDTICEGDADSSNAFDPSLEWVGYAEDTFNGLGTHTANCGPIEVFPTELFFSEYLEGSGNNKALEIYNGTGSDVDLSDYQVLYYNNGASDPTITLDLTGILAQGDVLVLTTDQADQEIQDIADLVFSYPSVVHFNGDDALALYKESTTSFVDVIGRIGEDPGSVWGTGDVTTGEHTLTRMETICEGDTNPYDAFDPADEWNGFPQDTFTYLGSHTTNCTLAEETAPAVESTMPADGAENIAKDDNIVITFNESVTVTDPWFEITCTDSGSHTAVVTNNNPEFVLDPDIPFSSLETCTVTIFSSAVTDDDVDDPPDNMAEDYSFTFQVAADCGDPFTRIYDIQGSGLTAAVTGDVSTEGIVVGDFQEGGKDGFYIQDMDGGDGDVSTSDGIFVYAPSAMDVNEGDHVRVAGTSGEYFNLTQISASQVWLCESGLTLPDPTVFSLPATDELDFEKYEGMLVTIPQDLVISEYFNFDRFGEIMLTTERYMTYTAVNEPDIAGYTASQEEYFLNSITLDDGRTYQNPDPAIHPNGSEFTMDNLFRGGDLVSNVTGIVDYSFDLYRIQPTQGADYTAVNTRSTTPDIIESDLKVASFNVLNYFTTLTSEGDICGPSGDMECRGADTTEELTRQRTKILAAMSKIDADIFGLIEIENDRPGEPTPDYAVADLVAGLNDIAGAGTFDYIPTGAIGTDAIKQALIYKPASVTPVGSYQTLTSAYDSKFIDDKNRPTLAQVFSDAFTGEEFVVAVNHLKSKGSECVGDPDLGDGAGNCNLTRKAAAEVMVDWLADETIFPDVGNYLIIGDLNSYDKEDPIDVIKAGPDDTLSTADDYVDMIDKILGEHAYGYVFDGHIGYLDYALANKNLETYIKDVVLWHINADEPDIIDYDMSYKQPAQDALYNPDPYRSSDHDPVIVSLSFRDTSSTIYLPIIIAP